MRISVIIPSFGRPDLLAACVSSLAAEPADEVLVGIDGDDEASVAAATSAWRAGGGRARVLRVECFRKRGANDIRRDFAAAAGGDLLVTLNDDVTVQPGCIEAHRAAHLRAREEHVEGAEAAIVVGDSPYKEVERPSWLDAAVQHTDLVFTRRSLSGVESSLDDIGFRAAATLNWSAPRQAVLAAGNFAESHGRYGHDDLELAFRMHATHRSPVLYESSAVIHHHHRHTAVELLRRDYLLGASMQHYGRQNPAFAAELVGHDPLASDSLSYYQRFVETEIRDAKSAARVFISLAAQPWHHDTIHGGAASDLPALEAFARSHTVARRWLWRRGLLDAERAMTRGNAFGPSDAEAALLELEIPSEPPPAGQAGIARGVASSAPAVPGHVTAV